MSKYKNIIYVILVVVIIIISISSPSIIFHAQDIQIFNKSYAKSIDKSKIDVQVKENDLVNLLHNIHTSNKSMYIADKTELSTDLVNTIIEQLDAIGQYNVIDKAIIKNIKESTINKDYLYTEDYVNIEFDKEVSNSGDSLSISNIMMETNTNKIVSISIGMEYINSSINVEETLLRNYVQYLGLENITDWKYNENVLESKMANLTVFYLPEGYQATIAILPTYRYNIISNFDSELGVPVSVENNMTDPVQ